MTYAAERAPQRIPKRSPTKALVESEKSTPVIKRRDEKARNIPPRDCAEICAPRCLKYSAAKIGCRAARAVPAATEVNLIAAKNAKKCPAKKAPAITEIPSERRFSFLPNSPDRIAKGAMISAPPRLRQKIRVGIGIELLAIRGPEDPIPKIPAIRKGMSRPSGSAV